MSKPCYELVCHDTPESLEDLHRLVAYKINPKLAAISNKYYLANRQKKIIESWINEYDGARVRILYTLDTNSFNNAVVEYLYDIRDLLISSKIDLNGFKHYIAELACITSQRHSSLFNELIELLNILGCKFIVKKNEEIEGSRDTKSPKILYNFSPGEVVSVTIKITKNGIPVSHFPVIVTNIFQESGHVRKHTIRLITNTNGYIKIPVKKYSQLNIKAGNIERNIIISDKNLEVNLNINNAPSSPISKEANSKIKYIVIVGGLLLFILLFIHLLY